MSLKQKRILFAVIVASVLSRLIFALYFTDLKSEVFYLEYGNLSKNLLSGNGYSLFHFENNKLDYVYKPGAKPFPSAYMPPGYSLLTLPLFLIQNPATRNVLFFVLQSFLAGLITLFIFRLTNELFGKKTGLIAAGLYAFLPEFIYSATSFGTTLIYHLLILLIFLEFLKYQKESGLKHALRIIILSSILLLFRMEFILFLVFFIIFFILKKDSKYSLLLILCTILTLLPWQVRNYKVFGEYVPMTTSGGLNLYRGHNPYRPGVWADDSVDAKIILLPRNNRFEINFNKMYTAEAVNSIRMKGICGEIGNFSEKLFHLWIYNPYYEKSKEPSYLIFWLVLLAFSITGIVKTFSFARFSVFYMFLVYHSLLAGLYFIIPRYQTMMKPALLPFAATAIIYVYELLSLGKSK